MTLTYFALPVVGVLCLVSILQPQIEARSWDPDHAFDPFPSQGELSACADVALGLLLPVSFGAPLYSDPLVFESILEKDMYLADVPAVRRLLGDDLTKEKSLTPMLDQIKKGITEVHPALGANLCAVLANPDTMASFSSPDFGLIKRSIHHMFILDKIVNEMARDKGFMREVYEHVRSTVRAVSPHKSSLGHMYDLFRAAGLFGVAKSYTIDGAIEDYLEFREKGVITSKESDSRRHGLTLNVFEAKTTDRFHKHFTNARAGDALAKWHPSEIRMVNGTIEYVCDMKYARLYETWNLAFITGNLEFHNLLYPKLLIPSVLLAKSNDYLYHRVLALWLSINFYLLAYLTGKEHTNIPNKGLIADLMGEINLKYSEYLS